MRPIKNTVVKMMFPQVGGCYKTRGDQALLSRDSVVQVIGIREYYARSDKEVTYRYVEGGIPGREYLRPLDQFMRCIVHP